MDTCPLGPDVQIKRKVKPAEGLCLWFADVPEGGLTEDTYLFGGVSEKGSKFEVKPHFHPNSSEYFVITGGKARFQLEGQKEAIVEEGGRFVIPRGVVHSVSSHEDEHMAFKARGDLDLVAERDFLLEMFTLVETNQFGLFKKYACWYKSGNFVPQLWYLPKTVGRIVVWLLGGVLGSFLGLGKVSLKED